MSDSIHNLIRDAEHNYVHSPVKMGEYVEWDMHETIETIDAYVNSQHISGKTDSLGREKPFFNIVSAAVNIWYRATDLDRKDVKVLPNRLDRTGHAFVATVLLREWMRTSRFGNFLNEWGRTLAKYGSAVVKFVEKDGELMATVVPWNRIICDPIDFDALPRIEKLYRTPAQLRKNKIYDQDVVKSLIDAVGARKNLDGTEQDQSDGFIEIYEVHGELEEEYLTDEESESEVYVQQMHVVSFVKNDKGEYEDFTLYRGREAKDPYMITHLIPEDGRTLSIGAVEYLFDAQWMVNHSQKNIKDTLDLASKLIFQTSDSRYVGRNALSAIETGDIMVHEANSPLTQLNNSKADITAFMNFSQQWQTLAGEITSTPDAIKGNTLPSGTPYSLGAYLGAQANSLFEIMTENKGLYLTDMIRVYILPYLKKKMNTSEEIIAILDSDGIAEVDAMFIPKQAVRNYNKEVLQQITTMPFEDVAAGATPDQFDPYAAEQKIKSDLGALGNRRSFKPSEIDEVAWNEILSGFEENIVVEVTNENTDKQAVLTTLSSVLQTIASNPAILQDPNAKMIFSQILTETGRLSPIQLSAPTAVASPPTGGAEALQGLTQPNNEGQ